MRANDILSHVLPQVTNFEIRKEQLIIANKIEHCLETKNHLIFEAGTGSGKSLAYLVPATLYALKTNKKAIISTATKLLQKQLFDKELPLLKKAIGDFRFAMVLGGENYLCSYRLLKALDIGLFDTDQEIALIQRIGKWQQENSLGTLFDIDFHMPDIVWHKIRRDRHLCTTACAHRSDCTYLRNIEKQHEAQVLITNHNIILSHLKLDTKFLDNTTTVIFDECHELEAIAATVFSEAVDSRSLMLLLNELHDRRSGAGLVNKLKLHGDLKSAIARAIRAVTEKVYLSLARKECATDIMTDQDFDFLKELQTSLSVLCNFLKKDKVDWLLPHVNQLNEIVTSIDAICDKKNDYVNWKSLTTREWTFTSTPTSVSTLLRTKIFKPAKITTIHASATIAVCRSMAFYRARIGIDKAEELIVGSPFDYRKQAAVYIPRQMPDPEQKEQYFNALMVELGELINYFHGRTLILTTNYSLIKSLYEELVMRFPAFSFMKQGDLPNNQLIELFKRTPTSVLIGAFTYWQGVNIPGNPLQCVVITKLPFGVPTDPLSIAHQKRLRQLGLNPFWSYEVPRAIIQLKQGFGRLIRSKTDRGVVAILDARIMTKKYGNIFLKALPECNIINDITELDQLNFVNATTCVDPCESPVELQQYPKMRGSVDVLEGVTSRTI